MKIKIWFIIIFTVSIIIRLFLNFSHELIPGINGGYYPLQVRAVLNNGYLAFADMPFLFYLDAFLIKIFTLFGLSQTNSLILIIVKLVDSICLPFLLFPLYTIINLFAEKAENILKISVLTFAVLSFSPLILISDLQKNTLAVVFVFYFLSSFFTFLKNRNKKDIILSVLFATLTGLTHFGTFTFLLSFIFLSIFFVYRKKAILPAIALIIISLTIIYFFDSTRFFRLITVWNVLFEKPALFDKMLMPPDILSIQISVILAILGIVIFKRKNTGFQLIEPAIIFTSIVCLIAFSFPLLDAEYFKRLSLFLFVVQIILIVFISVKISSRQQKIISVFLFLIIFLSVFMVAANKKTPVIDPKAYTELQQLKNIPEINSQTILVARHGLEWWTAWTLNTKVANDKALNEDFFEKYNNIIFINQIAGFYARRERMPFHEPEIPKNSELIFSTNCFKGYKYLRYQK